MIFAPFELTFERIGRFERRGGDLWWAGIALTRDLKELQNALSRGMASVGFELDSRPFKPHVTLARQILEKITITAPQPFSETVRSIELMESTRIDSRLTYVPLFRAESR
jgi:2'-5' RNA ligase